MGTRVSTRVHTVVCSCTSRCVGVMMCGFMCECVWHVVMYATRTTMCVSSLVCDCMDSCVSTCVHTVVCVCSCMSTCAHVMVRGRAHHTQARSQSSVCLELFHSTACESPEALGKAHFGGRDPCKQGTRAQSPPRPGAPVGTDPPEPGCTVGQAAHPAVQATQAWTHEGHRVGRAGPLAALGVGGQNPQAPSKRGPRELCGSLIRAASSRLHSAAGTARPALGPPKDARPLWAQVQSGEVSSMHLFRTVRFFP